MRPNRNMTQMSKYGIELHSKLEAETDLATGWKQCGSVNVAATRERMQVLRNWTPLARSLHQADNELGLKDAGDYALDAPSIEAGRRGTRTRRNAVRGRVVACREAR